MLPFHHVAQGPSSSVSLNTTPTAWSAHCLFVSIIAALVHQWFQLIVVNFVCDTGVMLPSVVP